MRAPLPIAVAQPLCLPHDVAANAVAHAEAVRAAGARVVVFPELSLTGYEPDSPAIAADDPRLAPLVEACADTGSVALAGAPVPGDHIAVLAVTGSGARIAYRKVHLGGDEPLRFTPGDGPAVLEVDGWRLGLAVCKDTGVAEHAAATAALGAHAYVAGTVKASDEAALQHERARRIATEHRLWVAVASFAGPTGGGFGATAGRSAVWDPDGEVVAEAGTGTGELARAQFRDGSESHSGAASGLPNRKPCA